MTSTSATDFLQKTPNTTQRVKQPYKGKHSDGFIQHAVIFDHPELTVSSLGHEFSRSPDGLGENTHNAFPHSGDDPFGLATS